MNFTQDRKKIRFSLDRSKEMIKTTLFVIKKPPCMVMIRIQSSQDRERFKSSPWISPDREVINPMQFSQDREKIFPRTRSQISLDRGLIRTSSKTFTLDMEMFRASTVI